MAESNVTNTSKKRETSTIKFCGCRHGDLGALKSFSKAGALYYLRPNKFLDQRGCLDCKLSVVEMKTVSKSLRAVVFYCDQGIKGFDAPDDDQMKSELSCDLVLCPQCEATRRLTFETMNDGQRSRGSKRNKQQSKTVAV